MPTGPAPPDRSRAERLWPVARGSHPGDGRPPNRGSPGAMRMSMGLCDPGAGPVARERMCHDARGPGCGGHLRPGRAEGGAPVEPQGPRRCVPDFLQRSPPFGSLHRQSHASPHAWVGPVTAPVRSEPRTRGRRRGLRFQDQLSGPGPRRRCSPTIARGSLRMPPEGPRDRAICDGSVRSLDAVINSRHNRIRRRVRAVQFGRAGWKRVDSG